MEVLDGTFSPPVAANKPQEPRLSVKLRKERRAALTGGDASFSATGVQTITAFLGFEKTEHQAKKVRTDPQENKIIVLREFPRTCASSLLTETMSCPYLVLASVRDCWYGTEKVCNPTLF